MAISACPNCFRRVIPNEDSKCPNCQTAFDGSNPAPDRVLLGLKGGSKLPAVCHNCGIPTRRTKRVDVRFQPNDSAFPPFLESFLSVLSFAEKFRRISETIDLGLSVPICDRCARQVKKIEPHYVDFDEKRIDLIVHRDFRKAVERADPGDIRLRP